MDPATLETLKHGIQLQLSNRLAEAEEIYRKILREEPENADANHLLGLVLAERDDNAAAIARIEKAIQLNGAAPAFHHNIAGIYRRLGRGEDATAAFRRAIALKPDYGEAYQGLAEMAGFAPGDPFIGAVLAQLARDLPDNVKSYLHFAAGKYLDDIGDYSAAFEHMSQGNRLAHRSFDSRAFTTQIKETLYVFSRARTAALGSQGRKSGQPVFVVGMPRSGTSLVEQILASHSRVYGAGELNVMKHVLRLAAGSGAPFPVNLASLKPNDLQQLADVYLSEVARIAPSDVDLVVDKHPLNFQFVGLILLMFPDARIIHTVRHPLDTCLSCYFQNFTSGQDYTFDLKTLAAFFTDYQRLMEHWDTVFPDRILHLEYEGLVHAPEPETRRLLDYCGLDFEPGCLEFYKTDRMVKTASFQQVRQPVYTSSINRWKNYSAQLGELARALGMAGETPVTISSGLLIR